MPCCWVKPRDCDQQKLHQPAASTHLEQTASATCSKRLLQAQVTNTPMLLLCLVSTVHRPRSWMSDLKHVIYRQDENIAPKWLLLMEFTPRQSQSRTRNCRLNCEASAMQVYMLTSISDTLLMSPSIVRAFSVAGKRLSKPSRHRNSKYPFAAANIQAASSMDNAPGFFTMMASGQLESAEVTIRLSAHRCC